MTQESVNATLKQYVAGCPVPAFAMYYVMQDGATVAMTQDDFDAHCDAQGCHVDPFFLSASPSDEDLAKLNTLRLKAGFKAQVGYPFVAPGVPVPDMVELGSTIEAVTFNLLCRSFQVFQYTPPIPDWGVAQSWATFAQTEDSPWYVATTVDLELEYLNDKDIPPAIEQQLANTGDMAFSLQQLLFDLSNPLLQTVIQVKGLPADSDAATLLNTYFVQSYFAALQNPDDPTYGQPVLGISAVASTPITPDQTRAGGTLYVPEGGEVSLLVNALDLHVNPYLDAQGAPAQNDQSLATLDYLCMVGDHMRKPGTEMPWNWIDASEGDQLAHGAVSINRTVLSQLLQDSILPQAQRSCAGVWVEVEFDNYLSSDDPANDLRGDAPEKASAPYTTVCQQAQHRALLFRLSAHRGHAARSHGMRGRGRRFSSCTTTARTRTTAAQPRGASPDAFASAPNTTAKYRSKARP